MVRPSPSWLILALLASILPGSPTVTLHAEEGFVPLFDGKTLEGWTPVNTAPSTWSVRDGMIHCTGKPIGELRTVRMYQNFILEVEWRHLKPRGNAGIFVWADAITARGQPFHRSIEVQVLENAYGNSRSHTTHGDIFPIHGARMTPVNGRGGSRAFPTEFRSRPSPEWNHYRITCIDGRITLAVNGKLVTEGRDSSPRKGYICLESEGGIVDYRNLRIRELPGDPLPPEHVALPDRGYRSLYTGVDLSGWKAGENASGAWQSRDWILQAKTPEGKPARLGTTETFGDFGFIVDFRPGPATASLTLELRDAGAGRLDLLHASEAWKAALEKTGRWNRLEGTLEGAKLGLTLNGRPVPSPWKGKRELPTRGPLILEVEGACQLANIFVRPLSRPEKEESESRSGP